jgi:hypothetical protein
MGRRVQVCEHARRAQRVLLIFDDQLSPLPPRGGGVGGEGNGHGFHDRGCLEKS